MISRLNRRFYKGIKIPSPVIGCQYVNRTTQFFQYSTDPHVDKWKTLRMSALSDYVSKNDPYGILNELNKISLELFEPKSKKVTDSELAAVAANICVLGGNDVNYELGCDIFDTLIVSQPLLTEAGYIKLLDICMLNNQSSPLKVVYQRMTSKGIRLDPQAYDKLIGWLLTNGSISDTIDICTNLSPTNQLSCQVLLSLSEPLFLSRQDGTFLSLFQQYVSQSNTPRPLDVMRVISSVIWAIGRSGRSFSQDPSVILESLHRTLDQYVSSVTTSSQTPSSSTQPLSPMLINDFETIKAALTYILHTDEFDMDRRGRDCLGRLRWKHMFSQDYRPYAFIRPYEPHQSDLESELFSPDSSLPNGALICASLFPDMYRGELSRLVERDEDERERAQESDRGEEEEEGSDSDSDGTDEDEEDDEDESGTSCSDEEEEGVKSGVSVLREEARIILEEVSKALLAGSGVSLPLKVIGKSLRNKGLKAPRRSNASEDEDAGGAVKMQEAVELIPQELDATAISDNNSLPLSDTVSHSDNENDGSDGEDSEFDKLLEEEEEEEVEEENYAYPVIGRMHKLGNNYRTPKMLHGLEVSDLSSTIESYYDDRPEAYRGPLLFAADIFGRQDGSVFVFEPARDSSALRRMEHRLEMAASESKWSLREE